MVKNREEVEVRMVRERRIGGREGTSRGEREE